MSIKHQVDIHDTENIKAKLTFEREGKIQGVMINEYHTDKFNTSKFMEELLKKQQKLRFIFCLYIWCVKLSRKWLYEH